ncbi:MAG: hypothetical protein M1831_006616 [Alyxoria varia]|nr:MAG: hypothetical protein M1831_006616 [Alyxoria varia]
MARVDSHTWSPEFRAVSSIEPMVMTDKVPHGIETGKPSSSTQPPCSCPSKESIPFSETAPETSVQPLMTGRPFVPAPAPVMPTTSLSSKEEQNGPVNLPIPFVIYPGLKSTALKEYRAMNEDSTESTNAQFRMSPTISSTDIETIDDDSCLFVAETCITKLDTENRATSIPFPRPSINNSLETIEPASDGPPISNFNPEYRRTSMACHDLFVPIRMDAPPQQIPMRSNHPVPRLGFRQTAPLQTNKFWGNLALANRNQGVWTHPYLVGFSNGEGNAGSRGLYISHVNRSQTVLGPGNPAGYYVNPIGIHSLIISTTELGTGTSMTLDSLRGFSVNMNLSPHEKAGPIITFPLLQGMAFVTGVYSNACPLIQSDVFFKTMTYGGKVPGGEIQWYSVILADGTEWLIYISPSGHSAVVPTLTFVSKEKLVGSVPFSGYIQIAKNPNGVTSKVFYDRHAGVYPLRSAVQASVDQTLGKYQLAWTKGGDITKQLLMFALDHHLQALPPGFSSQSRSALQLQTTSKGVAAAVVGDSWLMEEKNLPIDMDFAPWSPTLRSQTKLSPTAKTFIRKAAAVELNQDYAAQSNLDSMYFSGKALAKFADIVYAAYVLAESPDLARPGLFKLKQAIARFISNTQINPLLYDSSWGGLVSSCTYKTGDPGCDFGNAYYNDHHFHYSYFVKAAAVIARLDPGWLNEGTNKAYIDALLRDFANPLSNDPYFPFSRNFDWYHGHSWAHGLFESADGKDQESSSEDVNAAHAEKLWGHVTGDTATEARGNLKLAIMSRTISSYFLMDNNNRIHPPQFVPNKVVGILFENKADHTTYFGTRTEFIQGIHMIPLIPASALVRSPEFVRQEWNQYFSGGRADQAEGGWRGILYANLALYDPKASWNFFARPDFNPAWLDGGASKTWYLAFAAGLGGAPS